MVFIGLFSLLASFSSEQEQEKKYTPLWQKEDTNENIKQLKRKNKVKKKKEKTIQAVEENSKATQYLRTKTENTTK